jgi:hypothetical protein
VLTGQPLADTQIYALCATWPAPEARRPGAVWAHALLVDMEALHTLSVWNLLESLDGVRGTTSPRIESYLQPRVLSPGNPPPAPAFHADDLFACAHAAFASRTRQAHVESSSAAEASAVNLWAALWPDLQRRFSFRTRTEARRAIPRDVDLYVVLDAPLKHPSTTQDTPWLTEWTQELRGAGHGPLMRWFDTFGPSEPPRPASVRALGRLWQVIDAVDADEAAERIVERYPEQNGARRLKSELFGGRSSWWRPSEGALLAAIMRSQGEAWDVEDLALESRLADAFARGDGLALVASLPDEVTPRVRDAMLSAAARQASPELLAAFEARNHDWAVQTLAQTRLGQDENTWRLLDDAAATRLLVDAGQQADSTVLAAALSVGRVDPVVGVAEGPAIGRALRMLDDETISDLARLPHVAALVDHARPADVIRFGSAGAPVTKSQRRTALRARRAEPDEAWLRQAVVALADDPSALRIVFGPLHRAITEDRLPHELWDVLGPATPEASDPARRLRLLLVRRARAERWPQQAVKEALNGAGPFAGQVLDDLDDDDPITKFFKRSLKRLKIL